jgi:peptide-methionine (S)-S-oxide reductase
LIERAGFGGGCHWCTEAIFQALAGVQDVEQGFISSTPPHAAFSEAVDVAFDPTAVTLADLIAVHLATHSSTANHSMRHKYRSAVYVHSADQAEAARSAIEALASEVGSEFVTLVLPFGEFKPSDERYHNYYRRNPARPFCEANIEPKLAVLRQRFANAMKRGPHLA